MADPVISEIKYLGNGNLDILEVRLPDDYPDPENLRLVIYDRNHDGSTTASPSSSDIYDVTADGLLYTEDVDNDGNDDDGILHYTFGTSENGTTIFLHAQDAVGLYNAVTGETYGLYNWSGASYTVSSASGDPFAGQTATLLDNSGQVRGVTSLVREPDGDYVLATTPDPGSSYICFTAGTDILTPSGFRGIESLQPGDEVVTKDFGAQPIRWIGCARFAGLSPDHRELQPITVPAHAFAPNVPSRDTAFSPQHAVLMTDWRSSLYFGADEVLVAAKSLLHGDCAMCRPRPDVHYFHILLDRHCLINANGLWSESLFLADQSLGMLSEANRAELLDLFPGVAGDLTSYGARVRPQIRSHDAEVLLQ